LTVPRSTRSGCPCRSGAFLEHDLEQPLAQLLGGERFDLAASLEVAEHLSSARADGFVEHLTRLSDRVLFSAEVPGQGGYGHRNEQPHETGLVDSRTSDTR
jgi:hypothetical protein